MKKCRIFRWIMLAALAALWVVQPVMATQPENETGATQTSAVEIRTAQQLQDMALDPTGSYILMEDVDMTGFAWTPVDFSGKFDGNGHAILNLTISAPSQTAKDTYDGNLKVYSSCFAGLFGVLKDAEVTNLKLLGVNALIDTDQSCFLGGVAGYAQKSTITGCTVKGSLELRAHTKMMGVGGLVGYGGGSARDCDVDVTLICTDTDETTRDEQFLGGILGMGFFDVEDCTVTIDGYISDWGYVHSGGLVGMLLRYPVGDWTASICNNYVTGKITFFESNWDRRAYCKAFVGELMTEYRIMDGNTEDFEVDERFEYDRELRPEMCETPEYRDTVVEGTCYEYGYTSHMCQICGYTYRDTYTAMQHLPETWEVTREATTEQEGVKVGYCACGQAVAEEAIAKLEPEPTEAPTEPETETVETEIPATEPQAPEETTGTNGILWLVAGVAIAVALMVLVLLITQNRQQGKFLK